jgi:Asp-tRNA(Asn)/Glu-tRNA(Gln) amidotransferase B subunit
MGIETEYGIFAPNNPGINPTILCAAVVNDPSNADQLRRFKAGNKNLINFFFGDVMKRSMGQLNPKVVRNVLSSFLEKT